MKKIAYRVASYCYLFIYFLAEKLRAEKEKDGEISKKFVEYNNSYFLKNLKRKLYPKEIMILLPHCIQNDECNIKITSKIERCVKCGRCNIGEITEIAEKTGIYVKVANGGTLARKAIVEFKPKAVIAIACERDLITGIFDSFPMPVYGIFNIRENGPCYNTKINVKELEEVLEKISAKEEN